jgi:quinol monooxygenase YgiN
MTVVVLTTIPVKDGRIDEVARRFEETNRPLVADEPDWLGAWFTGNRERSEITNIALWRSSESYERLRSSEAFQDTMRRFADVLAGPPVVTVNELLVEMKP